VTALDARARAAALAGLFRARARAAVYRASAEAMRPDVRRSVVEWADAERILPAGVSPKPGRWKTSTVPYLREPMEVLRLAHPARRVTLLKSAQLGGSECGVNLLGQIMAENPQPCLVVLPAKPNATQYDDEKLAPMVDHCPTVRAKVRTRVSRSAVGSTKMRKSLPGGGFVQLAVASTSRSLQSRSVRVLILEEISEYPFDVDNRGDPVDMAEARTIAYTRNRKVLDCSTPGTKGRCRVSNLYAKSSRGSFLVPCPHCGEEQTLEFVNLKWPEGQPQRAEYHCRGCGVGTQRLRRACGGAW
jgi:phage terminase large subunit GpA-like protein